jgi:hypothetical protein
MALVLSAHWTASCTFLTVQLSPVLALSQLNTCFLLQMAGTIATYEIVLVQFSHMAT